MLEEILEQRKFKERKDKLKKKLNVDSSSKVNI